MLYADDRRLGEHGIGQFTRHVLANLDYSPIPLRTDPDAPLDPVRLSRVLGKLKQGDLFFSPGYNPPLRCPVPFLITLHDLNHLDRPENSSRMKRLYYALIVKRACHQAAGVLTVSEFSRGRVIDWSGISPEKVVNVGSGVGPEFNPDVTPYELPFPYMLCVSNRRKHKNELRQIEAFARSGLAGKLCLVLTGEPTAELAECIEINGVSQRVHFLGLIPAHKLPSLYRGAQALAFVSLYEGFGLPLAEAMACGTPVLTSNTTALPEISGDAALLVDPRCVDEIAAAMERIIHDDSLRQRLRERGLARAAHFTWDRTATLVRNTIEMTAAVQKEC